MKGILKNKILVGLCKLAEMGSLMRHNPSVYLLDTNKPVSEQNSTQIIKEEEKA